MKKYIATPARIEEVNRRSFIILIDIEKRK